MDQLIISRATAGDGDAFRMLSEPYAGELRVHCYRMLGSTQDAEDALQDTLLAAWRGLATFEQRSSMRTWLYRIATNRCLDQRRSDARRPAKQWDVPNVDPIRPTGIGEVVWLEPFPDVLSDGALGASTVPAARYEQSETISLAFVSALQTLPPRQVAVLILRDVLGFHTDEVAGMLTTSAVAVNSALSRARAGMRRRFPAEHSDRPALPAGSAVEQRIARRFAQAWESADVDALVELLTDEVFISMPPIPFEYQGRSLVGDFFSDLFAAGRRFDLVPTRANRQPAFGAYLRSHSGDRHGVGLYVLTLTGHRISAMTRFDAAVMPWFDLPASLPSG